MGEELNQKENREAGALVRLVVAGAHGGDMCKEKTASHLSLCKGTS